jgi:hypothetical protein
VYVNGQPRPALSGANTKARITEYLKEHGAIPA